MPNHCENTMTFSGPPKDLAAFRDFAKGQHQNQPFSMESFLPTPGELLQHPAPNPDQAAAQQMTAKHGFPDWWEWRLHHWGTRADAYEVQLDQNSEGSITYRYLTAWSPFNEQAMTALSQHFPSLHLRVEFLEPLMAFEGHVTAQGGQVLEAHRQDFDFHERYRPVEQ